jgi:hypothetical protein
VETDFPDGSRSTNEVERSSIQFQSPLWARAFLTASVFAKDCHRAGSEAIGLSPPSGARQNGNQS